MSSNENKSKCNCFDQNQDKKSEYPKWKFAKKKHILSMNDNIYNYNCFDLFKKNEISFDRYKDQVLLVVNVASFCTYTLQYLELNELQVKYNKFGFNILGFPSNQFGHQEPGSTAKEILNSLRYVRPGNDFKPNFQLFEKCDINGANETKLFKFLKSSCPAPIESFNDITNLIYTPYKSSDVRWNFEKFLINRDGKVVMRFQHETKPKDIEPFIEVLIKNGTLNDLVKVASKINDHF